MQVIYIYPESNILLNNCYFLDFSHCPWLSPTDQDDVFQCKDGTFCNVLNDGWDCCLNKLGRKKCPKNFPYMCANKSCYKDDYCCEESIENCSNNNGLRTCSRKNRFVFHIIYFSDFLS